MMPISYHEAKAGRSKVRSQLEEILGVPVALGVQPNPAGEGWALTVNLTTETKDVAELPKSLDGIPLVVEVVEKMKGLSGVSKKRTIVGGLNTKIVARH